ncbi:hypothetical protein ASPWEDRAFT_44078 [Aspergillus wentii DTO 134E9]|uniref:Uncharacterized protein n=1 Tax=Aspergillus wentii DTO 134E9 TaxID=1073089 RepID=A0A1L9RAV8_ASPWE|nr:uncharacterized protein ASPWEDRAFT_44078 [Aspergillus wentii DTO 134E9]KAI9934632.1 hypothetical protein MW887_000248 [Aspergillus wentii]OJJ32054.1 hypothetical protein ASPWEDRAFT_44078 [Aspergillus wentii DTO 134E9]
MSASQIPPVTLEDLQAFQAKHFSGYVHTPTFEYPSEENEPEETADDEDDLGYYPDGVKRTLTDEQIRIFRHSEIHSILRQRQLQEEEALYQAGRNSSSDKDLSEGNHDEGVKTNQHAESSGNTSTSTTSDSKTKKENKTVNSDAPLDYDEGSHERTSQKPGRASTSHFPGRRIVSYED